MNIWLKIAIAVCAVGIAIIAIANIAGAREALQPAVETAQTFINV